MDKVQRRYLSKVAADTVVAWTKTTLSTPADATAIASCKTFTGSIAFATNYAPAAELNGVEVVEGSVIVANNSYDSPFKS